MTEDEARQRVIRSMCPDRVCRVCGEPSRRLVRLENQSDERQALARYLKERRLLTGMSTNDLGAFFPSASGGLTGCVRNWEYGTNVPTAGQWPILKTLLGLDDRFDLLVTGERTWTESEIEYSNQNGRGFEGDRAMGRGGHQGMPRAERYAPDRFSDCGHDDWRPGVWIDPFADAEN